MLIEEFLHRKERSSPAIVFGFMQSGIRLRRRIDE